MDIGVFLLNTGDRGLNAESSGQAFKPHPKLGYHPRFI
jgi:hypothetical protein